MATDLGKAYIQIAPSAKGISGAISREIEPEANKAGSIAGNSLVGSLKKIVIAAGIGKLITESLNAGGELEQNLGGAEAVYGEFADGIKKTASDAYKNMGLSQSDYLETVNKMGSLLQGSGMGVEKSMNLSSDAMQRAADVASVMGVDTEMAMESIAGAAKGEFRMMDNLGVAMNATSLEAYALEKGMNFKWKTASNAEKTELAMQMFMDRTSKYAGNFAKESEETFSGSLGAMKSAFTDLIANLSLGNDITPALMNLGTTIYNFAVKNLFPMLMNIGKGLISALGFAFTQGIPLLMTNLQGLGTQFQTFLTTQLPVIMQKGVEFITNFANGFLTALPDMITKFGQLLTSIGQTVLAYIPTMLQHGYTLITNLATGLWDNLPAIVTSITNVLAGLFDTILQHFPGIARKGFELIGQLAMGLWNNLPEIITTAGNLITEMLTKIGSYLPKLLEMGLKLIGEMAVGIINAIPGIVGKIPQVVSAIIGAFSGIWESAKEIGANLLKGLWSGITSVKDWLFEKIGGFAGGLVDKVKGFFGIQSPSRVFRDEVGSMIGQGMAIGIEGEKSTVSKAMDTLENAAMRDMNTGINLGLASRIATDINNSSKDNLNSSEMNILEKVIQALSSLNIVLDDGTILELSTRVSKDLHKMNNRQARALGV